MKSLNKLIVFVFNKLGYDLNGEYVFKLTIHKFKKKPLPFKTIIDFYLSGKGPFKNQVRLIDKEEECYQIFKDYEIFKSEGVKSHYILPENYKSKTLNPEIKKEKVLFEDIMEGKQYSNLEWAKFWNGGYLNHEDVVDSLVTRTDIYLKSS